VDPAQQEAVMAVETPVPDAEDAQPGRPRGFLHPFPVDVRQVGDQNWETLRALEYHATYKDFEVPVHSGTDFASVPRVFVWFIPRYGRYTKAAILHDYLCRVEVRAGRISRIDADGIFRQAMRELGVPFLRRWIMWAAVRLGALTDSAGRKNWWKEAWRAALIAAIALPVVGPAAGIIVITLLVLYVAELLTWIPLQAAHQSRKRRGGAKAVNRPQLRWKL
jgi:hypothetical protein